MSVRLHVVSPCNLFAAYFGRPVHEMTIELWIKRYSINQQSAKGGFILIN